LKALNSDKSLSPQDRHAQAGKIREDLNTDLKGILTGEQFAKWEKLSTHHRNTTRPAVPTAGSTNAPPASN